MSKPIVKFFRVELGVCLLVPFVVLIFIVLFGYGYVAREKRNVMRQVYELADIPLIESRVVGAKKTLSIFRISNGGKENGEWANRISQAASAKGVVVKAINTEKVMPERSVSCHDYRVQVTGEGSMSALVGWLAEIDQPARCFKVGLFKMRPVKFNPFPVYEFESVFQVRALALRPAPGPLLAGRMDAALEKLLALRLSVSALGKAAVQDLDTRELAQREKTPKVNSAIVPLPGSALFKLTGIVNDERKPLALTDRGVFGVGDMVDGYKVVRVGIDQVIVENGAGQSQSVQLYQVEANQ